MGLKPSPLVGRIQRAVYELQLDGRVRTLEEAREAARPLLEQAGPGVSDGRSPVMDELAGLDG
jgi:hypothetical protein